MSKGANFEIFLNRLKRTSYLLLQVTMCHDFDYGSSGLPMRTVWDSSPLIRANYHQEHRNHEIQSKAQ